MDEIDILPKFQGLAVHGHWKSYETYTDFGRQLDNCPFNDHGRRENSVTQCLLDRVQRLIDLLVIGLNLLNGPICIPHRVQVRCIENVAGSQATQ